jgi:putative transcriptional regulator
MITLTKDMAIKWRLKAVMADREMNYKQLAELTGLHPITVNRLVNTYEAPDRIHKDTLDKFCKALNCQVGDLMRYEDDAINSN